MADELAGTVARLEREWPLPEQVAAAALDWIEKLLPERESAYVRQAGRHIQALREQAEAAAAREARLRKAMSGMLESYDLLVSQSNPVLAGVVHGFFVGEIPKARAALAGPAQGGEAEPPAAEVIAVPMLVVRTADDALSVAEKLVILSHVEGTLRTHFRGGLITVEHFTEAQADGSALEEPRAVPAAALDAARAELYRVSCDADRVYGNSDPGSYEGNVAGGVLKALAALDAASAPTASAEPAGGRLVWVEPHGYSGGTTWQSVVPGFTLMTWRSPKAGWVFSLRYADKSGWRPMQATDAEAAKLEAATKLQAWSRELAAALEGGGTPEAPIGSVVCKADLPLGDDPDRCSAAMAKGRCEREAGHEGFHETRRGNYAWARTRAALDGGAS